MGYSIKGMLWQCREIYKARLTPTKRVYLCSPVQKMPLPTATLFNHCSTNKRIRTKNNKKEKNKANKTRNLNKMMRLTQIAGVMASRRTNKTTHSKQATGKKMTRAIRANLNQTPSNNPVTKLRIPLMQISRPPTNLRRPHRNKWLNSMRR